MRSDDTASCVLSRTGMAEAQMRPAGGLGQPDTLSIGDHGQSQFDLK